MVAFLAGGVALMLALTYTTLVRQSEVIVRDRLSHALGEIAESTGEALERRSALLQRAAGDPAVRDALLAARDGAPSPEALAAARAVLDRLPTAPSDSTLPIELWDAHGRRLLALGTPIEAAPGLVPPLDGSPSRNFGPMHLSGGRVRYWTSAPVVEGGEPIGQVVQLMNVGGPRGAVPSLREMLGEEVSLYTRGKDGAFWVEAPNRPVASPLRRDAADGGVWYERPAMGRTLAVEAPLAGTPWMMVLEAPESSVLRAPQAALRTLALLGLLLTAAGAVLSWRIGRRITGPITDLTAAAEQVATGRYDRRARGVRGAGRDEIGRLVASFDSMAHQVGAARRELEDRVTDAQGVARELERANRQLRVAMRDAERARADAERARAEAESASRAKSDFLAVMSHELRTPLNAIGGYTQLLEMGLYGPVTEAQRDALGRVERSQAHLLTLINDVLSFARIDAGQVRYVIDDVPLKEALDQVEALVEPQVRAHRLAFHYRPAPPEVRVRADRDKLRQVVLNLLANAVKYTPPGGAVVLECEVEDDQVQVHVRDTGTGIRADRLPLIFEPFVQGERALNRPDEGVGLGLAISRDLTYGMGGELRAESEVGRGSTFTLVLPRAVPAAAPIPLPLADA